MAIKDTLHSGDEARVKLMSGIKKTADAVAKTMGTGGQNTLLECIERPGQYATNDGFTIANSIHFEDPLEDMGRKILCEAINRANKSSGDGSSTTCVLTQAILEEGQNHLTEVSPMEIKRSLEACIPLIEASIKAQTKEITVDNVAQVASISAEDEGIGARIQEIYQKIGKDGVIQWDVSKTAEDSYSIGTGITVHGATYVSRYMCDMTDAGFFMEARLTNPVVLLARRKITSTTDFDALFQTLFNKDIKEIVIFVDDIEPPVINALIQARQKIGFRAVVVKMPVLWADQWWEDLAIASGATVIDGASGIKMRNVDTSHLGTFEHMTIGKEDTVIEGVKDMSKHLLGLKVDGSDEALQRAERLNTKTARYFVGAHSESALAYRRLKVEDAINAASCALEHGIVAGGGVALWNIAWEISTETIGGRILDEALKKPLEQIVFNTGEDIDTLEIGEGQPVGYDSKTGKIVNMFEAGIVDASDVVLNAVRSAIGVAASILTVGTVVTLPREDTPPLQVQMPIQR